MSSDSKMATNSTIDDPDLELFILIWLDNSKTDVETIDTRNQLHKLSKQFKTFDNRDQCESYIRSLSISERIVLIVSGRLGREIVPSIHKLEQISSIYIYCMDKAANEEWSKSHSKIRGVLTKRKELIEQIRLDNIKKEINDEPLYINIYNNTNNQFIHSQLLIHYLLKIKINLSNKSPTEYIENNSELKFFEEFQENSLEKNIFWWLTKDKFLIKLLTKALDTRNIDLLHSLTFYIQDINQKLQLNKSLTSIHVYHCHFITNQELEELKNSMGELISINTFFLTTNQRDKALQGLKQSNKLEKILFEISADPDIDGVSPFADITAFCYHTNQSQILFMLGSIFWIKNIYQQDDIWICHMYLSSIKNDQDLKAVFEQIKIEDGDCDKDRLAFGNILARIGKYDDAGKYYLRILNELPPDHEDIYICYRNLGNIAYLQKNYDKSLEYHSKSLEIQLRLLEPHDPSIADSYNCLGIVHFNLHNYNQAIDCYKKALDILQLTFDNTHPKLSVCLNNIGLVYRMEQDYSQALDYYQQALVIDKRYLSDNHTDLGEAYHNIGALYWCLGLYDNAMEYYKLSLENKNKSFSANHPSIAMTLENIGLIYENKNDFQQALNQYEKASKIYHQTLSLTHPDVLQIEDNIRRVSSHLKK